MIIILLNGEVAYTASMKHLALFCVTLCAACHARLHRLGTIRAWIPEPLVPLWAEQRPGIPIQLQLAIT